MIKNICLAIMMLTIIACNSNEGSQKMTTPSGYDYTHVKMGTEKIGEGEYVTLALKVRGSDGIVLQDLTDESNMPVLQIPTADKPLPTPNPIIEAISGASIGDSITIVMPIDSMPSAKNNPQFAKLDYIEYVTVINKTQSEVSYKAEIEAKRLENEALAEKSKLRLPEVESLVAETLKDYKANKLKTTKLDSGLEYVIHEEGDGIQAENGKRASVNYYGVTMDGKMFDNSFRRGAPYPFTVGRGEVIKGWDLGIAELKKGTKATLFIPYDLAYGEGGSPPNIGPKSNLLFYVEVADVN